MKAIPTIVAIATVIALSSAAFAAPVPLSDKQMDKVTAGAGTPFDFAAWLARNFAISAAVCPGCTPNISYSTSSSP